MKKVYYEKVGDEYVPVAEYDSDWCDSFRKGSHLIMVYPGGVSRRYNIDPALAPMVAAGRYAEDAMVKAMFTAAEGRPSRMPTTPEQRAAWGKIQELYGSDLFSVTLPSIHDVVWAGVCALESEAQTMLSHPAAKDMYDQFMLTCKLTQDYKEKP